MMEFVSLIKMLFNCGSGVKKSIKIYLERVLRSEKISRVQIILAIQGSAEML